MLPPFDGTERACSSEYLAGTTLNELSECQSRLPIANSRLLAYQWAKQGSHHVIYVDTDNNVRELYLARIPG